MVLLAYRWVSCPLACKCCWPCPPSRDRFFGLGRDNDGACIFQFYVASSCQCSAFHRYSRTRGEDGKGRVLFFLGAAATHLGVPSSYLCCGCSCRDTAVHLDQAKCRTVSTVCKPSGVDC